ncbi:MAG: winged helix-turn-helix domain-containing protein [Rhodoluna sp.]
MTITNNPFVREVTEARGFALYVGIDEQTAKQAGTSLAEIVRRLRKTLEEIAPGLDIESFAAVALAKAGCGGRNVDIVRAALSRQNEQSRAVEQDRAATGVVIDLARRKVFIDGKNAELTEKEFSIVEYLVECSGETIPREELLDALWLEEETIAGRTIDVHLRRLRAKLGGYEDIFRTVRGQGYRFDKHPDVLIEQI